MGVSQRRPLTAVAFRPLLPLVAAAVGGLTLPAMAQTVDLVAPNFICDSTREVCYDAKGPSIEKTGAVYGERAERRLLRELSGRPPVTTFSLSNGALCDVSQRTCWDDGNTRRNVSNRLTKQLYSGGGAVGSRTCQLLQRGRSLFNGTCSLSRRNLPNGTAFLVQTQDGRRYSFFNEGSGRLVLRDATGVWPVTYSSAGNQVAFRWADIELLASRSSGWGSGQAGYGGGVPEPRGTVPTTPTQALETLLNGLFR